MMFTQFAMAAQGGVFTAEQLSIAGSVTLQGMLSIFGVLAILWGMIELMHVFLKKKSAPKAAAPKKAEQAPAPAAGVPNEQDAAIAAAIGASLAAYEDAGATVAAITAAIMALRAENGETGEFRVVSFKRAGNAARRGRF